MTPFGTDSTRAATSRQAEHDEVVSLGSFFHYYVRLAPSFFSIVLPVSSSSLFRHFHLPPTFSAYGVSIVIHFCRNDSSFSSVRSECAIRFIMITILDDLLPESFSLSD